MHHFTKSHIELLHWPAKSPDLNLIEEVWSMLKRSLKQSYSDVESPEKDVKKGWKSLESTYIKTLYGSMRRRIQAVIDAEGSPTDS